MKYCDNCDQMGLALTKTSYGDYLCEHCYNEYINTEEGMLEFLVGICNDELDPEMFDADFLGEVAKSWQLHYDELDFTPLQCMQIEEKARELGIL